MASWFRENWSCGKLISWELIWWKEAISIFYPGFSTLYVAEYNIQMAFSFTWGRNLEVRGSLMIPTLLLFILRDKWLCVLFIASFPLTLTGRRRVSNLIICLSHFCRSEAELKPDFKTVQVREQIEQECWNRGLLSTSYLYLLQTHRCLHFCRAVDHCFLSLFIIHTC